MSENLASLFRRITTGVYVIGVAHEQRRNAFTAAWLIQASFDPLLLALSINPQHASYPLLKRGGGFAVSVLGHGQLKLAKHFGTRSARQVDKLATIAWRPGRSGAPILVESIAYFDCRLAGSFPGGDHEIALGRVVDGAILAPDTSPLTYGETGNLDGSAALYPAALEEK